MDTNAPLVLVDGSSYLYRAYFAMPDLQTSSGFPTSVIRGVIGMIQNLKRDYPESTIVLVFDAPGKTFRDELYAEYKANRPSMPDDMSPQIQPLYECIEALGFPLLVVPDVEADDVLGTLSLKAYEAGLHTVISTSDKDLAQLVNERVTLVDTMKNETLDRDGVISKFGVSPERIIDYLTLVGDKIDNIPGIPSVGPKTAAKWLTTYGDLEGVRNNADQVGGKVGEKLRTHLDQLSLSRDLATIKCDVQLNKDLTELQQRPEDASKVVELFTKYELNMLLRERGVESSKHESQQENAIAEVITTLEALSEFVKLIQQEKRFGISLFLASNDLITPEIVGISICPTIDRPGYIPTGHVSLDAVDQLSASKVLEVLRPVLQDPSITAIAHNAKELFHVLASQALEPHGRIHDVMLCSYVLNSTIHNGHSVKALAGAQLGRQLTDIRSLVGSGAKQLPLREVSIGDMAKYASAYTQVILQAFDLLIGKLEDRPSLLAVYEEIDLPLEPVLCQIERNGTLIDRSVLEKLSLELTERMSSLQGKAFELAGEEFNIASPKQLQRILYDKLELRSPRTTKTGQRSTAEEVLVELRSDHALPSVILDYRGASKLKSTYTDSLQTQINHSTKRIHTTFDQANASTGRLASMAPNLQNIPIRTADGRRIREAFIAPPEHVLLAADYSQIELRVMAHMSEDPGLKAAFENGLDIHQATAAEMFNKALEEVSPDDRRNAKAINFGLMYGMSPFGLARNLGINQPLAREYIERYFTKYPNVQNYMEQTTANARETGYVETIFGRRIHLNDINSRTVPRRQAAERLAINAPVQGSAADIIKRATLATADWLTNAGLDAQMLLQVHDELVFEVAEQDLEELRSGVIANMSKAADLSVDLVVDTGSGQNWAQAH